MSISSGERPPTLRSRRIRPSAGIGVLLAAMASMVLTGPGQTIGVSVFIDSFVEDLSLTRTEVSTVYAVGTLAAAPLLPRVGRWIDQVGVRRSQIAIGVLFALALINMSLVIGIVTLTIGFFGIRLMGQGSLSLVSTVTVSQRFLTGRGTALGLHSTVAAGGLALVPVLLAAAIGAFGWRGAWVSAAIVVGVAVPGLAWFGLRDAPGSSTATAPQDAHVVGAKEANPSDVAMGSPAPSVDRDAAVRTFSFWAIASISSTASLLVTALNFHQIDLLGDIGLSEGVAAAMFLPQVIGSSVFGLGFGAIADRIGTRFLLGATGALMILAQVLAATISSTASVFVYAVALGAAGGAARTTTSTLLPLRFGTKHLGSIEGTLRVIGVAASAIGPVALAVLESMLGSYPQAILILSILAIASTALAFAQSQAS